MKIKLLIFIFFLVFSFGFSQNSPKDSIYVDKLFQIGDSIEYKEPQKALDLYKEAYQISNNKKYYDRAFHAVLYTALVHNNIAQYDSAFYYLERSEKLAALTNSALNKAKVVMNRANTYHLTGNPNMAVENHLKSITYLEKENDSSRLSNAYANLAAVYAQLNYNDKEISYFNKSINVIPHDDYSTKALTYGDIATAYIRAGKFNMAKVNLIKSDSIAQLGEKSQILPFFLYSNWGNYYRAIKDFKNAISYYKKSLIAAKEINYNHFGTEIILHLGESYWGSGNVKLAEKHFLETIEVSKRFGFVEIQQKAHGNLGGLYKEQGKITKAFDNLKLYDILKDSLNFAEHTKQISQLETQFQSEKKDKELLQQNLQLEQQETELQKKKKENGYITGAALLLLVGSTLLWFLYQQRQKRKNQEIITLKRERQVQTLESLMEGEEKERMRIAKELHDGVNVDLSAIKYKLTSLLEKNNEVINEAVTMIDRSCEQVRAISHNLIPPSLKDFSLVETLEDFCATTNSLHKPAILFNHIGEAVNISKKAEVNIFRIVQELVNNSIKHANATEITVQVSHRDNSIQLTVEDNGVGFDKEKVENGGIGLKNIQSRVDYLQAKLDFNSNDNGTSYIIDINTDELV